MSSLRGEPGTRWPLSRAIETMAESARRAAAPSTLWVAGFFYQCLSLGWTFGWMLAWPILAVVLPRGFGNPLALDLGRRFRISAHLDPLWIFQTHAWFVLFLLVPVFFRFATGLAVLAPRETWERSLADPSGGPAARRSPRLRQALRQGRGVTRAAIGLWLQVLLMMLGAALLFVGPVRILQEVAGVREDNPLAVLGAGIAIALILFYGFVLSILFQIALHSLVQNRRGVGSALLHAWRIAKNDPLATARASAVDATLCLTVLAVEMALGFLSAVLGVLVLLPLFALEGLAGATRCLYWAHTYRALGGISTVSEPLASDPPADDSTAVVGTSG